MSSLSNSFKSKLFYSSICLFILYIVIVNNMLSFYLRFKAKVRALISQILRGVVFGVPRSCFPLFKVGGRGEISFNSYSIVYNQSLIFYL
jgi:hypothetical protein